MTMMYDNQHYKTHVCIRPLQFNWLSYKLFGGKNPVRLKKSIFQLFLNFKMAYFLLPKFVRQLIKLEYPNCIITVDLSLMIKLIADGVEEWPTHHNSEIFTAIFIWYTREYNTHVSYVLLIINHIFMY